VKFYSRISAVGVAGITALGLTALTSPAFATPGPGASVIYNSAVASTSGCGYDSLNIALSRDPTNVTVGSDPNPGTVWQYSDQGSAYCDGGTAGTSVFRLDSPASSSCWGVNPPYTNTPYYVPAVQFKAGVRNG